MMFKNTLSFIHNNLKISNLNLMKYSTGSPSNITANFLDQNILNEREKDMPVENSENPYQKDRRECVLCKHKITPNYKNTRLLAQFVSPYTGRIYGKHITGLCTKQQRNVESAITTSRSCGYMPYYLKQANYLKDPKLFDPERPFRLHKY